MHYIIVDLSHTNRYTVHCLNLVISLVFSSNPQQSLVIFRNGQSLTSNWHMMA